MAVSETVKEQVAALFRRYIEAKFGDRVIIDEMHVIPRWDQWDEEYLHIRTVVDGDTAWFYREVEWMTDLYRRMRPELLELGVTNIPVHTYIDKAEIAEWTAEERARLFV